MTRWYLLGGTVTNRSNQRLIVAYDHPTLDNTWGHSVLNAGETTPFNLDIDGFRAEDTKLGVRWNPWTSSPTDAHTGWWKIHNRQNAIVRNVGSGLEFSLEYPYTAIGLAAALHDPVAMSDADFDWSDSQAKLPLHS